MSERLCIFGEVLFDHFPDGKRVLGGAPFNVAWHLQAFGQAPHFISRVGADADGAQIRAAMQQWGMDTGGLQTDPGLPTGRVEVRFNDGEPSYDIVHPCAYDAIAPPQGGDACRMLYHGTLALREDASRQALTALEARAPQTVFVDVNLRPPWWGREQVAGLLRAAHWVKLNADELAQLHPLRTPGGDPGAASFLAAYELEGLVVTHGARGAELLTAAGERFHARPQPNTHVVDTVGAGDAFTSVMILGLVSDWPPALTLERAQAFASRVVGNRGATVNDPAFYQSLVDEWQLAN
jgi:fructokinase